MQGGRDHTDTLLYYTTTGWMMWNWEVTALATCCSLVLYYGSPLHPHNAVLWDLVDKCGITVFGTSAKWIAVQEDRGLKPRVTHSLASLRAICSTGSPLTPKSYDYVYRDIKANVLLASITGGTDIIACFAGENSVLPVYRGEIQSAHLGCGVAAWDEAGAAVTGEAGELVCTAPFPSMPVRWSSTSQNELTSHVVLNTGSGLTRMAPSTAPRTSPSTPASGRTATSCWSTPRRAASTCSAARTGPSTPAASGSGPQRSTTSCRSSRRWGVIIDIWTFH